MKLTEIGNSSRVVDYYFKQKLNDIGWWGVGLMVVAPTALGITYMKYFEINAEALRYTMAGYEYLAESVEERALPYLIASLILAIISVISPVMVLIGREYHRVIRTEADLVAVKRPNVAASSPMSGNDEKTSAPLPASAIQ